MGTSKLSGRLKAPLWLARGALSGACVGVAIALFMFAIECVTRFRKEHWWMYALLPAAAVLTVFTYRKIGSQLEKGTTLAIDAINEMIVTAINPTSQEKSGDTTLRKRVPLRLAPVVFFSSVLSHAVGASAGKEGAGVQIGTAIAGALSRLEHFIVNVATRKQTALPRGLYTDRDRGLWIICGAGAAFGALFNAPIAGTLFGMQVASPRINRLEALAPCLTASFIASWVGNATGVPYHTFPRVEPLLLNPANVLKVVFAAICFGLMSQVFCFASTWMKRMFGRIKHAEVRVAIAATMVAALTLLEFALLGDGRFNGLGFSLIDTAYAGQSEWWVPLVKLVFTALTLAASLKGGEVVPLLVCGGTLGAVLAGMVGLPPSVLASYGAVATLSGATKLPVVCFALGLEFFGATNPALLFLACSIGYLTSGSLGIYEKQLL